jgi:hypothetical protein
MIQSDVLCDYMGCECVESARKSYSSLIFRIS